MQSSSQMAERDNSRRIPEGNHSQRRMTQFNTRRHRAEPSSSWADDEEKSFGPTGPPKPRPTQRSRNWKSDRAKPKPGPSREKKKTEISDPAEITPTIQKAKNETLRDDPIWQEGPFQGTHPIKRIYSQNLDHSTFPLLIERTYADLESLEPRIRRELPLCAFQHVYTSILNAVLIDHVRTVNAEDRFADEESPMNLIPEDIIIPGPIDAYYRLIASTITPQSDMVKVNIPDAGIPAEMTPAQGDVPMIPAGTFGVAGAENHNSYECYVSPYVTRSLIEETIRQNAARRFEAWNPLPAGLFPHGTRPNQNLLGYRPNVERLNQEGVQSITDITFMDQQGMASRLQWCPELVARCNGTLKRLETKYKMVVGKPTPGTNSAAIGWTCVGSVGEAIALRNGARLSSYSPTIKCNVALGTSQTNIVGLMGLKRERTDRARGLCYTTADGGSPPNWAASRNNNFAMVAPFGPAIGADFPSLRTSCHEDVAPHGDRGLMITTWTRRNFVLKKDKG